uniref:Uncharacterized protein n=1 Tax=Arundo donax TaxID=35708 RepID=A0A0A9FAM5_ARUDO
MLMFLNQTYSLLAILYGLHGRLMEQMKPTLLVSVVSRLLKLFSP